jgi:hypothetical protein
MGWGRKPSCVCDECAKCKRRIAARERYRSMTLAERRAWAARRDRARVRRQDRERHERMKGDTLYEQRRRAVAAVNNAVRDGRLKREPCETCGSTTRVNGHHHDYSKPLEVRWLCPPCHAAEHEPAEAF